ncbi:MAG: dephospho-CoA kinase [Gammaproteobacteria bacterium]|nr:MAG: dephospho-CoA kinase [Gammaproteobacteria bacterium]UTW43270.1 dephospho-CoA kinase [bacterium SCSIO 12844]
MLGNLFCVSITGGIASGKTTVLQLFKQLNIHTVSADHIARDIVKPNTHLLTQIIQYFGDGILQSDGTLNRKALREIIFISPQKRQWLENLLHPVIREEIIAQAKKSQSIYCIIDIPLLPKTHSYDYLDYIITVDCSINTQITRLINRDNTSIEKAYQIIDSQPKRAERYLISDYIIQNINEKSMLKPQVESIHKHLLELANKVI